jgi:hypothetical protein
VNLRGVGITSTISRAELAIAATIISGYTHGILLIYEGGNMKVAVAYVLRAAE